jgi:L-asparaginase/Glu-tRNA(Gln) amidotransferase subunit D
MNERNKKIDEYFSPKLKEQPKIIEVNFFKLGGTWDMVFRENQKIGSGSLDDDKLFEIQNKLGYLSENPQERVVAERKLVSELYARFQRTKSKKHDVGKHLSFLVKNKKTGEQFDNFVRGSFIPLFSGDSSHLTNYIIAPMVTTLIERAIKEPHKPILGGQGTDTADIALLQIFDVMTFDTKLPPLLLAGANRSWHEMGSDAPENFVNLGKLAHIDLNSGAYWVFHGNLYKASDLVKIDPQESRLIEEQSTFHSPHKKQQTINEIFNIGRRAKWNSRQIPTTEHVVYKLTAEALYDVAESVYTDDLGSGNSIPKFMKEYYDPKNKVIVVGAHSLGNVDNARRYDAVNAAKAGKLVINVSRTLIGAVSEDYVASLLSANHNPQELNGTGKIIISAHKLNKTVSHALAVRAILEDFNQAQTQKLFDDYACSRELL